MMKKLIVSIHDVTPVHAHRLEKLVGLVEAIIGPCRTALFAVPDFHGQAKLNSDPVFASRLRSWSDAGNEVFLHGYFHQDNATHNGGLANLKARHLTAGEGEFLGLDHATALARLRDGRSQIEDIIGRPVAGFVAPAWLYGKPAIEALAELGFALAEDHFKVWQPQSRTVLTRGPVITYASRTPARLISSLLWSRVAGVVLKPASVVRVGVHPHDWDAPELVREIGRTLRHFSRSHLPSRYADLPGFTAGSA